MQGKQQHSKIPFSALIMIQINTTFDDHIWFQAASCSKSTEAPGRHSSKHTQTSVKRKKHSAQHKKHPSFQCKKYTTEKEGKSETEVCCPLCKEMLPGDDGLLDHFGQGLCPKDRCIGRKLAASRAQVGHPKAVSNVQYNGEPALSEVGPDVSSGGPALSNTGPEASSGGPALVNVRPDASISGLGLASLEPDARINGPSFASLEPEASSEGPALASLEPEASSDGPALVNLKPEASSDGPALASLEPEANSDGQALASIGPHASSDGPALASLEPEASSDGPALASIGPEASSDGLPFAGIGPESRSGVQAACSRRKGISRFTFNKFSHRKEADLEKVDCGHSKKLVGHKRRINH